MTHPSAQASAPTLVGRVILAVALVAATAILAAAFRHFVDVRHRDGIHVAGSARQRIQSDRALWRATVRAQTDSLVESYRIVQQGTQRVRELLRAAGVPDGDISVASIETHEIHPYDEHGMEVASQVAAVELFQDIHVTSDDVALVGRVSREVTALIEEGINISSQAPEYIYTELGDVKIRLVGEATADARQRAEQVAEHSGARVRRLVSATVGVVQVNAANETEVSWDGVYDRSTVDKDVTVVVRTFFELE